ncbi:MAG: relaxase/mobilization nuclease domain-containing protein [Oscillospiraceae bacterium]|nr:relaxase/mobilization nuclease domain-containing protein [Oscillospiraceae bacterium]
MAVGDRRLQQASDQLCLQYGLSVIKPKNKRTPGMSAAEYRSADKGQSWKLRLAIAIDEAMAAAMSLAHFMELMELEGYQVRWEDDRKYITYTTPEGKRCRDIRLHEAKYLKENMEREFRIRKQILRGSESPGEAGDRSRRQTGARLSGDGEELERSAEIPGGDSGNAGSLLRRDADPGITGGTGENPGPAADDDAGAPGRYEGTDGGVPDVHRDDGDEFADTGWECERQLFRRHLERGNVYEILEQEAALDLGDPFGGADPAGAGALDLVGSLSRIKGDSDDPEERKREIEAQTAADNLGVAIGLAIAAAEAILERENEMKEQTM